MSQPDREVEPSFSQPIRQVVMIAIALCLFGLGAYVAYPRVAPVFLSNPELNGAILVVFAVGIIACLWQVMVLIRAVGWIMAFTRGNAEGHEPGRLLAPLAGLMRNRGAATAISASSARSILDSVATRIEEARDITRYITSLLIFLGLLGTFYGLATTVPAVVETIRSLAPSEGEGASAVFGRLMTGLEGQLGGMGTAFASSLLGLAGSLIVGLLELFVSHGQNRFARELEEWLSSITRLGFAGGEGEGSADSAILEAFAEHMAGQMDALQQLFSRSDLGRAQVDERLGRLAGSVEALTAVLVEQRRPPPAPEADPLLRRIAEGQERLATGQDRLIAALADSARREDAAEARAAAQRAEQGPHVDAESRMRLRSIDVQLLRILEEMAAGRQESIAELRADLAALTKAVRQAQAAGRDPLEFAMQHAKRG